MTDRRLLLALTLFLMLWATCMGVHRANAFQPPTRESRLVERVKQLSGMLDSYMKTEVFKCAEGDLVLDATASATAGEAVYTYSGQGCRVMMLPEPSVGIMLAIGCLGLAGWGRRH